MSGFLYRSRGFIIAGVVLVSLVGIGRAMTLNFIHFPHFEPDAPQGSGDTRQTPAHEGTAYRHASNDIAPSLKRTKWHNRLGPDADVEHPLFDPQNEHPAGWSSPGNAGTYDSGSRGGNGTPPSENGHDAFRGGFGFGPGSFAFAPQTSFGRSLTDPIDNTPPSQDGTQPSGPNGNNPANGNPPGTSPQDPPSDWTQPPGPSDTNLPNDDPPIAGCGLCDTSNPPGDLPQDNAPPAGDITRIPEPSSLLLMTPVVLGFARSRRRLARAR